jgi:thiol-disulfide isomerase/thioredoxin
MAVLLCSYQAIPQEKAPTEAKSADIKKDESPEKIQTPSEKFKQISDEINALKGSRKPRDEIMSTLKSKKAELLGIVDQLDKEQPVCYRLISQICIFATSEYDEAITYLDKMLKLKLENNDYASAVLLKTVALMNTDKLQEALKEIDSALDKFKDKQDNKEMLFQLKLTKAQILRELERFDEDKKFLEEMLKTAGEKEKPLIEEYIRNIDLIGKPPKDFTEKSLTDSDFSLAANKGKWILIDFWATWCGPCKVEMPNLKKLYAKYKDNNFVILGISLDNKKEELESYIKKEEIPWQQYFDGNGWKSKLAVLYEVKSIPYTVLIEPNGNIYRVGLRGKSLDKTLKKVLAKEKEEKKK